MRNLSPPEHPRFVTDRLSAVSNVPMQWLLSVCIAAAILSGGALADFVPETDETAAFVDVQKTASVEAMDQKVALDDGTRNAAKPCVQKINQASIAAR